MSGLCDPLFCYKDVINNVLLEMNKSKNEIRNLFENEIEEMGFDFVDMAIVLSGKSCDIRLFVDREGGITIDECREVSRAISDLIFSRDLLSQDYSLQVSSPGIDRPLKNEKDFRRNKGRKIELEYRDESEIKKVSGSILSVDEFVHLTGKSEGDISIPLSSVVKGKIVLQW